MKSFAEALSTPEMGKLIAASLERDEKRSEEALRWLLGDEEYERMRRSVEVDQIAGRFVGVQATPSPGSGRDPIGGRPVSTDLEASVDHGVGSTRTPGMPEVNQIMDRVLSTPTKVRITSSSGGNAEISVGETKIRYVTSASIQLQPRGPAVIHLTVAVPSGQLDLDVATTAGCVLVSSDPKISG